MTRSIPTLVLVTLLVFIPTTSNADWLPFSIEKGKIIIDVEISGQPAKAMLDSGAMGNLISSHFVEEYGQDFHKSGRAKSIGVNATRTIQLYNNIPVSLYGTHISLDKVAAAPLSSVDLILGINFFHVGILQIDYPNSRFRFLDRKSVDLKKQSNVSMKKSSDSYLPAIEVVLGGETTWLQFDTGNTGGLILSRSLALDRGLVDESTYVKKIKVVGVNANAIYESYEIDSVGIGPYVLDDVKMAAPAEGQSANLGRSGISATGTRKKQGVRTHGVVGYDVLKHFLVTVDCEKYQMHISAP